MSHETYERQMFDEIDGCFPIDFDDREINDDDKGFARVFDSLEELEYEEKYIANEE